MRIDRRKFLKTSGGALVGSGALAGILATGRAPAYAQNTTLHWLRLGDFVPASDTLLRQELLPQAEKALLQPERLFPAIFSFQVNTA